MNHPKAMVAMSRVRNSDAVRAIGDKGEELCDGVYEMMSQLGVGKGPKTADIAQYNSFWLSVLKGLEYFYYIDVSSKTASSIGKLFAAPIITNKRLEGKEAILHLYTESLKKYENVKGEHRLTLLEIKPLKTYGWLLSQEQREEITKIHQTLNSGDAAVSLDAALLDALSSSPSGKGEMIAFAGPSSSAASSSGPATKVEKKTSAKDAKAIALREKMLKFSYAAPKKATG